MMVYWIPRSLYVSIITLGYLSKFNAEETTDLNHGTWRSQAINNMQGSSLVAVIHSYSR